MKENHNPMPDILSRLADAQCARLHYMITKTGRMNQRVSDYLNAPSETQQREEVRARMTDEELAEWNSRKNPT